MWKVLALSSYLEYIALLKYNRLHWFQADLPKNTKEQMIKINIKIYVALFMAALLAACGGGGSGTFEEIGTDESGGPIYAWVPSSFQEIQSAATVTVYQFPLNTHYQASTAAYSSRVGKVYTTNATRCGNMTTPTVSNGIFTANYTQVRNYLANTVFEGQNVIPVTAVTSYTNVKLNGQAIADSASVTTSFYNSINNLYIGGLTSSSYTVATTYTNFPDLAKKGDTGTSRRLTTYADSSKTSIKATSQTDWLVTNVTADSPTQFTARFQQITYGYDAVNTLVSRSTTINDLTYSSATGASTKMISSVTEDLVGTTTSQISSICS